MQYATLSVLHQLTQEAYPHYISRELELYVHAQECRNVVGSCFLRPLYIYDSAKSYGNKADPHCMCDNGKRKVKL